MNHATLDRARGRWPVILERFGIDKHYLRNRHGPCPVCGGKDRFRFDDKAGEGTFFCNQCGAAKGKGAGINLLMHFRDWDFKTAVTEIDRLIGTNYQPLPPPSRPKIEIPPYVELQRVWETRL